MNYSYVIYTAPAALIAIVLHEMAHGFVSYKLGDPTPKYDGRLSPNPMNHLDFMGTICLIFLRFGWAKPVRINSRYYKNRRTGVMLTAIAGPLMNYILAFVGVFGYVLIFKLTGGYFGPVANYLFNFFRYFAMINVGLGTFNLIPIPPLDGSKILSLLIHGDENYSMRNVNRYGYIVLAMLAITGVLSIPMVFAENIVINFYMMIVRFILKV